jgi:hypothetical protein
MPVSKERLAKSLHVTDTPRHGGLVLTITVKAYDNGMIEIDGIPVDSTEDYDKGAGWLGAAETITSTLNEFRRRVERRARELKSTKVL